MSTKEKEAKSWSSVKIAVGREQEDLAAWVLMQCGSLGCEVAPIGSYAVEIYASFDEKALDPERILLIQRTLEEYGLASSLTSLVIEHVPNEDWLARFKEGFEPFAVGNRFLICPPWKKDKLDPRQVGARFVIWIDPGMAFGTGLHASTQYCLRLIERSDIPAEVLDVGTGSSILAIACVMVNPETKVLGLDVEDHALQSAKSNLRLNKVTSHVQLVHGSTDKVEGKKYDLILSNLTFEDISALLADYTKLTNKGASIICAGILQEKLAQMEKAISAHPFKIHDLESDGKWVGLVLKRI